jgi:hypothetical protein
MALGQDFRNRQINGWAIPKKLETIETVGASGKEIHA